jgi:alkylhydroperoxidase family enzyme
MTVQTNDGGTDSVTTDAPSTAGWSSGGAVALAELAPDCAQAFTTLVSVRPSGVHDELLESPPVRAFAEQFRVDVSRIDDGQRAELAAATGDHRFAVAQMIWIGDVTARLRSALDTLFGPSQWPAPRRHPVREVWETIDELMRTVAHHHALDATLTELVRLRGARQHHCRLCQSRRSVAAVEAGADEALFASVDDYATSDLPPATKAALALVDAMIWTPQDIPDTVVADVRAHLAPEQAVEVVLDVIRNAANKIAVALGADDPEVTEGVQLFVTDADGVVSTV